MVIKSVKSTFAPILKNKKVYVVIDENKYEIDSPPKPKLTASSVLNSLITHEFDTKIDNVDLEVMYYSYIDKLEIIINYNSSEELSITIGDYEQPLSNFKNTQASLFDSYVPVLGYTQKTKKTVALMKAHANKTILPLLVVGSDNRFENYLADNFKDMHFLDLSKLHITSNHDTRSKIEKFNQGKSRDEKKKLPQKEYRSANSWLEIEEKFFSIENKKHAIPTIRIDLNSVASISYAKAMLKLLGAFNKIALRVIVDTKNVKNLQSYLLPMASDLSKLFLICEIHGNNLEEEYDIFSEIYNLSDNIKIVYLSDNIANRNDIQDNKDYIKPNNSLICFKNLQGYFENLRYGDYCGFEKDTSVEPNGFPAKTAKIFYLNPINLDEYYIRRVRASSNTWNNAMDELQIYITSGCISVIQRDHCEACLDILDKHSTFSLGDMKENCIIHNGICIARA